MIIKMSNIGRWVQTSDIVLTPNSIVLRKTDFNQNIAWIKREQVYFFSLEKNTIYKKYAPLYLYMFHGYLEANL